MCPDFVFCEPWVRMCTCLQAGRELMQQYEWFYAKSGVAAGVCSCHSCPLCGVLCYCRVVFMRQPCLSSPLCVYAFLFL
jgi:hypothetical protein